MGKMEEYAEKYTRARTHSKESKYYHYMSNLVGYAILASDYAEVGRLRGIQEEAVSKKYSE